MEISIVMPVYNGIKYIDESVSSILNQTFQDFELLIIDDGSTDGSVEKIQQFADPRIRLIQNKHDFIDSLNRGMKVAKGKYIARMDVDDIMQSERLARQYELLERETEVAVCASWFKCCGEAEWEYKSFTGKISHPLMYMLNGNIIAHPTVMIRKNFLSAYGLQYENYSHAEDFKLWSEVAKKGGVFYVIPEFLMHYRISAGQISRIKSEEQYNTSLQIRNEVLDHLITTNTIEKEKSQKLLDLICDLNEQNLLSEKAGFDLFFNLFYHILFTRELT